MFRRHAAPRSAAAARARQRSRGKAEARCGMVAQRACRCRAPPQQCWQQAARRAVERCRRGRRAAWREAAKFRQPRTPASAARASMPRCRARTPRSRFCLRTPDGCAFECEKLALAEDVRVARFSFPPTQMPDTPLPIFLIRHSLTGATFYLHGRGAQRRYQQPPFCGSAAQYSRLPCRYPTPASIRSPPGKRCSCCACHKVRVMRNKRTASPR